MYLIGGIGEFICGEEMNIPLKALQMGKDLELML